MSGFQTPPPGAVPSGSVSPDLAGLDDVVKSTPSASQAKTAGVIGTPLQEAGSLAKDVGKGLVGLVPAELQSLLGIKSADTPEDATKKRQMLQRYQQMNAEQQQYVQQKLQQEQLEQRQKEETEVRRRQAEQAQKRQVQAPQGKRTGDQAAAGKKSSSNDALTQLENKRKKLNDPT